MKTKIIVRFCVFLLSANQIWYFEDTSSDFVFKYFKILVVHQIVHILA